MNKKLYIAILIIGVIAGIITSYFLLVFARSQYTAGLLAGYGMGRSQGKLEALIALQEWQYTHKCKTTLDGYVSLKMWRDSENRYQFECVVK